MEILKSLLKWIILAIIFIILIVLIIKFANKADQKKTTTNEPTVNVVEKDINEQPVEDVADDAEASAQENLVVDVQDTASTGLPAILLGLGIITCSGFYIYKNREVEENA